MPLQLDAETEELCDACIGPHRSALTPATFIALSFIAHPRSPPCSLDRPAPALLCVRRACACPTRRAMGTCSIWTTTTAEGRAGQHQGAATYA